MARGAPYAKKKTLLSLQDLTDDHGVLSPQGAF